MRFAGCYGRLRAAGRRVAVALDVWDVDCRVVSDITPAVYREVRPSRPVWAAAGESCSWAVIVPGDAGRLVIRRITVGPARADLRSFRRPAADLSWGRFLGGEPREVRSLDRLLADLVYPPQLLAVDPATLQIFGPRARLFARYGSRK